MSNEKENNSKIKNMEFEKEFRLANPQTIGESDSHFDLHNYAEWLGTKTADLQKQLSEKEKEIEKHKDNYTAIAFEFEELESKANKLAEAVSNTQRYNIIGMGGYMEGGIDPDKDKGGDWVKYEDLYNILSEFKGKENI